VYTDMPMWDEPFPEVWVSLSSRTPSMPYIDTFEWYPNLLQSAIADLILTVVQRTKITSFHFEANYSLDEGFPDKYRRFFIQTDDGVFILPSVIPDKAKFTDFVRQIEGARSQESEGCSVTVEISSDLFGGYDLLTADYDASQKKPTSTSVLPGIQPSIHYRSKERSEVINESQMIFRRDSKVHTKVRSVLLYGNYD
jgi:hypothetical protein